MNRIYKKQNRRSVWVELTEKGEKVVEILQATRVDFWSDLLSHLSEEERDQYFHIMKKYLKNYSNKYKKAAIKAAFLLCVC